MEVSTTTPKAAEPTVDEKDCEPQQGVKRIVFTESPPTTMGASASITEARERNTTRPRSTAERLLPGEVVPPTTSPEQKNDKLACAALHESIAPIDAPEDTHLDGGLDFE